MSTASRKDMWILLYNWVSQGDTPPNNLYEMVGEILCNDPSLIDSSFDAETIQFQKAFIMWLMNKFINMLGEHKEHAELQTANLTLQKRILESCRTAQWTLFQCLVNAYFKVIEELRLKLSSVLAKEDVEHVLELEAFTCALDCLREIDPNISFATLRVPLDEVNTRITSFVLVLKHALHVGYEFEPRLFIQKNDCIFNALLEVDLKTKIECLRYFKMLLSKIELDTWPNVTGAVIVALAAVWEQLPCWLLSDFADITEVEALLDISKDLLVEIKDLCMQLELPHGELMDKSFKLIKSLVNAARTPRLQRHCAALRSIIEELVNLFIFQSRGEYINTLPKLMDVLELASTQPLLLRLAATGVVQREENARTHFLTHINLQISQQMHAGATELHQLQAAYELLNALIYLEFMLCQEKQLSYLAANSINATKAQKYHESIQFPELQIESFTALAEEYLQKANESKSSVLQVQYLRIFGVVLRSGVFVEQLNVKLVKNIIEFIERSLRKSLTNYTATEREQALAALESLTVYCADERKEVTDVRRVAVANIARQLLKVTASSSKSNDSDNDAHELRLSLCRNLASMLVAGVFNRQQILNSFLDASILNASCLPHILKVLYCTSETATFHVFRQSPYILKDWLQSSTPVSSDVLLYCTKCSEDFKENKDIITHMKSNELILLADPAANIGAMQTPQHVKQLLRSSLFEDKEFAFVGNHLDLVDLSHSDFFRLLSRVNDFSTLNLEVYKSIVPKIFPKDEAFRKDLGCYLLQKVTASLQAPQQKQKQMQLLELICCAAESDISENWRFHLFKMTFFYSLHPDSLIVHESILYTTELCRKVKVQPVQLWNWYKKDALSLVVKLITLTYLTKGVRLQNALLHFANMLGFSCGEEFVCKYQRLLVTMILPNCVKEEQCKGLIAQIASITRKTLPQLFVNSFLRIYAHIHLFETPDVAEKCIELVINCTKSSLEELLNSDVKQTVAEFLIYFNRNPEFVMKAFQSLLQHNNDEGAGSNSSASVSSVKRAQTPTSVFAKFIADRFLGVLTYFEACLAEPSFEKPLKEEALYSLGQMIRFIGATHVTQLRFKIIAMLNFVLSLNDKHLQRICLKVWNIFLHIVNIEELASLLSIIVVSLVPLLEHSEKEVNEILKFLILDNYSLLGVHVSDLYFVKDIEQVSPAIREFVARHTEILKSEKHTLLDKLEFLYKQVTSENIRVRIYGLSHLRDFIAENREEISNLVLNEISMPALIEKLVDVLIGGCRHEDRKLRLAAAKCLGELGAIDASYMPPSNYSLERLGQFTLSMHTDEFAIMALTELCRAYQFQKNTKYVDCFFVAIQETLAAFGISPQEKKKLNVWDAVPMRMHPVMEPLLKSCYIANRRQCPSQEHPIFMSSHCRCYTEWAFTWAARLIDMVQSEESKSLLYSYKPSIKRDNNTLALFFPYILLHTLQDCTEAEVQQIYEEFEAVFSFQKRNTKTKPEFARPKRWEYVFPTGYDEKTQKEQSADHLETLEDIAVLCTKLCSEQIDFLERWVREWERVNVVGGKVNDAGQRYERIKSFLKLFDKTLIAQANNFSGDYARALMYLEQHIEVAPTERFQEHISSLIQIHGDLMDADSVQGAVYLKKGSLTLEEQISVNRIVDRPQEAVICYEQLLSRGQQVSNENISGMIDCYLRMETPETALMITDGIWSKLSAQYNDKFFRECKTEVLWRLGRYDELEDLCERYAYDRSSTNWNVQCGEAFLLFRQADKSGSFFSELDDIRTRILGTMRNCSGVKQNSYPHLYDEVVKLHLLNDMEKSKQLLLDVTAHVTLPANEVRKKCLHALRRFFTDWDARLAIVQCTSRVMEPLLCFRRNLLIETNRMLCAQVTESGKATLSTEIEARIKTEIGKLWVCSARIGRDAGNLQQAQLSIINADQYEPKSLFIEKAKLLWQKGDQTHTFKLINESLESIELKCDRVVERLNADDRALYAEAKYLQATYNAESMNTCSEQNIQYFKEAISCNQNSEKCHVQLAHYLEKMFETSKDQRHQEGDSNLIVDIMLHYAKSLQCGFENVYQSLPRLLSLWLDFTSQFALLIESSSNDKSMAGKIACHRDINRKINDIIINCQNELPASIFYTAFSQLLSRICHPSAEVYNILRTIIIKLVENFPHQSLWMLLPVFKSSHPMRIKRCTAIFNDRRLSKREFQKLLIDFNVLAERLIELTNKEVSTDQTYKLSVLLPQLQIIFKHPLFSEILLPFEKYMQVSFPIASSSLSLKLKFPVSSQESPSIPTNPFPYQQICIIGINEDITVLRSAAKPKKLSIKCSDGKSYEVMVKPKDDLRKDFRLMEFNGLVKRYLHQDPQARHRRLRIRTYAAIPFNEECGLVEWLPNLNSYRNICNSFYRMRGLGVPDRLLRQYALPKLDTIEKKRRIFVDILLSKHPPVFQDWFRLRFPTPHSWYEARSSYVKTVAVMSMVGYILGLGDRHGENLLFDETNGDAVHVDFNCLFNQGELFAYPELVPFRLTRNMIFAMGPLGVEGMYRKCCEITLRLLKHESKTLLSVLRPFVYDISRNYARSSTGTEMTDPKALTDVRRIEQRLQGYVKKDVANTMPLSTEGQVSFLIDESTDIDNLAAMYIGWGPYI